MLRLFLRYLRKIFEFDEQVAVLRDHRVDPQIPAPTVWKSVFLMFVLRLGSLNRLEQELRRPGGWRKLLGGRPPSADCVGYSLCRFSRERKRQETLARKRAGQPRPVEVDRVEMKLIPKMRLWDACGVPLQVTVLRKHLTNGEVFEWGLATPRKIEDPLEAWQLYELRAGIEERHRQAKCFWDLTAFRSPDYTLVVNQVVFTLLAYTLIQVFLEKSDREDITGKTRQRMWEELLPRGDKISAYVDNRVAHLNAVDYSDWLLGVSDGARRRLRGRLRALGRQRRDLPDLPPRS
jgi:hypothetical protein